jgi:hypothetical protein
MLGESGRAFVMDSAAAERHSHVKTTAPCLGATVHRTAYSLVTSDTHTVESSPLSILVGSFILRCFYSDSVDDRAISEGR